MQIYIDKELFQWEKNRSVFLKLDENESNITYIQFYNKNSKVGPEIPVINNEAKIPDYLLEENYPIMAVACTGETGKTLAIARREFKVLKRAMPEKYEDESNEPPVPGEPEQPEYDEEIIYDGGEEK